MNKEMTIGYDVGYNAASQEYTKRVREAVENKGLEDVFYNWGGISSRVSQVNDLLMSIRDGPHLHEERMVKMLNIMEDIKNLINGR